MGSTRSQFLPLFLGITCSHHMAPVLAFLPCLAPTSPWLWLLESFGGASPWPLPTRGQVLGRNKHSCFWKFSSCQPVGFGPCWLTCRGRDTGSLLNFQVYFDPKHKSCLGLSTESPQPAHPATIPHPFHFWPSGLPHHRPSCLDFLSVLGLPLATLSPPLLVLNKNDLELRKGEMGHYF